MRREAEGSDGLDGAIETALLNLERRQEPDGAFRCRYGGPMFLSPLYVVGMTVCGKPLPEGVGEEIVRHLEGCRHADGSVGLHEEGAGCMFTTVLTYVALRLLGRSVEDPGLSAMRAWIAGNGTALGAASWGKFFLALLNLYPYEGLNPILPELWLLPESAPFHPGRYWCHTRMVYLPMAYLYGVKARCEENELTRELRGELYGARYEQLPFASHRNTVAASDNLEPVTGLYKRLADAMVVYEERHSKRLRKKALETIVRHIAYEDDATDGINLGPVNSVLNAVVWHFERPGFAMEERAFRRLSDYLCPTKDGVHFNGYNSTALWDTAFAAHTLRPLQGSAPAVRILERCHDFIERNQVREDLPRRERFFRQASKGGWPFSDRPHGWPISDCTAEGFRAALFMQKRAKRPVNDERLADAIERILSMQNTDGGWASYERRRGPFWLERLNPSQVFSDIMVEHSYVECTASCVLALQDAAEHFPEPLAGRCRKALRKGIGFIRKIQRPDGGWVGNWGICFTYAGWFALSALSAAGGREGKAALRKGAAFLLRHQNADGGWGEHHRNNFEERWISGVESHAVQTAWALLALLESGCGHTESAARAARFLQDKQVDGTWPRQTMTGMFNKTTAIDYDNYRHIFPLWALVAYREFLRSD